MFVPSITICGSAMTENNQEKSSRRNFKIKIPSDLLEIVTMLEFLMQRKEMYILMCESFNKKLKQHQEKKINIMSLITPEYGDADLVVCFPDTLLAPVEAFFNPINMSIRDVAYNIVALYLIEVQAKMTTEDRKILQKIDGTRDRLFKLFHSIDTSE
jgi:hypothetical protein